MRKGDSVSVAMKISLSKNLCKINKLCGCQLNSRWSETNTTMLRKYPKIKRVIFGEEKIKCRWCVVSQPWPNNLHTDMKFGIDKYFDIFSSHCLIKKNKQFYHTSIDLPENGRPLHK